jgi:hypothetical protein
MDFSECMSKTDDPKKCADYRDDYLECLHHRKEVRWSFATQPVVMDAAPGSRPLVTRLDVF